MTISPVMSTSAYGNETGRGGNTSNNESANEMIDVCSQMQMPIDLSKPLIAMTYMYGFTLIELIGIPANILSFIVLRKDRSYSTTRTFLLYLTLVDTLILVVYFQYYVLKTIYDVKNYSWLEWVEYGDPYFYALSNAAKFAQIWLTVTISVDRFYAIKNPLKAPRVCTVKKARIACVVITFISLILNMPRWFRYYRVPVQCYNRTMFKFVDSPLLETYFPKYDLVYDSILDPLLYFYGPLTALTVLNTCLIMSVRRASVLRERMSSQAKNETGITVTLIAVVTTFIVCETPTVLLFALELCIQVVSLTDGKAVAQEHFCTSQVEDETLLCISVMTVLLNSSVNFFLYVLIGKKFRSILLHMLFPSRYKNIAEHRMSTVFSTVTTTVRGHSSVPPLNRQRIASLIDKESSASRAALIVNDAELQRRGASKRECSVDSTSFNVPSFNGHANN